MKEKGVSGSALKIIAMIFMLMDHTAAVVLGSILIKNGIFDVDNTSATYIGSLIEAGTIGWVYLLYQIMRRFFGRLAFPIYCFLLVEGFEKTHNKAGYARRMFLFALISEIPFDLAFNFRIIDFSYQNVFFTLWLGILMMWVIETVEKCCHIQIIRLLGYGVSVLGAVLAAESLRSDYGAKGIIAIALLYLLRKNKWEQIAAGCVAFLWEVTAPFAFVFVWFYNGRRGLRLKYVFYIFYPVHLLVLHYVANIIYF